ncbi:hypothetical protein D3C87_1600590 [compost metagenome]
MLQHGDKVALALHLMGPQPGRARDRVKSGRERSGSAHGNDLKLPMGRQEFEYPAFILLRREGAGGIDNRSTWLERESCGSQNLPLHVRIFARRLLVPLAHHVLVLAEHAFTRTRSIDQNAVKSMSESRRNPLGAFIEHNRVPHAGKLQIFGQCLRALRIQIVADQKALTLQLGRYLRRLASRRGA